MTDTPTIDLDECPCCGYDRPEYRTHPDGPYGYCAACDANVCGCAEEGCKAHDCRSCREAECHGDCALDDGWCTWWLDSEQAAAVTVRAWAIDGQGELLFDEPRPSAANSPTRAPPKAEVFLAAGGR